MRIFPALIVAGVIGGAASVAMAETNGPYIGAEAGLNIAPKVSFSDSAKTWRDTQKAGYAILGQLGYGFGQTRLEGEIGWRANDINKVTAVTTGSGSGSLDAVSIMANLYYDFPTGSALVPYLGVGIGGVDVNGNSIRLGSTTFTNDDQMVFGYQGIAGVSYALNDCLSLKADYRYLRTTEASMKEDPSWGTNSGKGAYAAHSLMLGFTYKFGVEKPMVVPVAAPAPVEPPKPVAAPIAKNFMVFFDFDKTAITADAAKIIMAAAEQAKTSKATAIHLTGHTDAAGTAPYNQALSLHRAEAVKAALVKLGIPAAEISVVGKGKGEQLVQTKDGVREPQNRRVQIVLE
ncbi:MAG TPA: OmpA family protein [Rhodospirillaceae bacterium]|nr:OmpA family protein [Rhodospirillaceae bacterium]